MKGNIETLYWDAEEKNQKIKIKLLKYKKL